MCFKQSYQATADCVTANANGGAECIHSVILVLRINEATSFYNITKHDLMNTIWHCCDYTSANRIDPA